MGWSGFPIFEIGQGSRGELVDAGVLVEMKAKFDGGFGEIAIGDGDGFKARRAFRGGGEGAGDVDFLAELSLSEGRPVFVMAYPDPAGIWSIFFVSHEEASVFGFVDACL